MLNLSRSLFLCLLFAAVGLGLQSCSKEKGCNDPQSVNYNPEADENDGSCQYPVTLSQNMADEAILPGALNLTGATFDELGGAHNGDPTADPNATIRDIFSNIAMTAPFKPGDVVAKRIYSKLPNGQRGLMTHVALMIKQPDGYYPEGGNWQYAMLAGTGADSLHQNGKIETATINGKIEACASCHAKANGGNFLFYR